MFKYMVMRVFMMLPTLLVALVVAFALIHLIPGDPALVMLGPDARPEQIEALRNKLGLNESTMMQFTKYITRVFQGDFGLSIFHNQPVLPAILARGEVSLLLAVLSLVVVFVVGIGAGIAAAVKPNSWVDQTFLILALIGASVPAFWLGLLLMTVFAVAAGWFPSSGFKSVFGTGNLANLRYLVLPALTAGLASSALLARLTRASVLDVLQEDYIVTARAKGVKESVIVLKHALRNASLPILTVLGYTFAALLSRTVVTEAVFILPGIGRMTIEAIMRRDYPVIQGIMIVVVFLYLVVNLLTDIAYGFLDPRIRYG